MIQPHGGEDALQERKYVLSCRVKFFKKKIQDHNEKRELVTRERNMVLLVPEENDEMVKFFTAWLPETKDQYFELVSYIGAPIHSSCRLAIKRGPDEQSEKHYLTVMSVGVEQDFQSRMKPGHLVTVTILPQSEDGEADFAKDTDQYRASN